MGPRQDEAHSLLSYVLLANNSTVVEVIRIGGDCRTHEMACRSRTRWGATTSVRCRGMEAFQCSVARFCSRIAKCETRFVHGRFQSVRVVWAAILIMACDSDTLQPSTVNVYARRSYVSDGYCAWAEEPEAKVGCLLAAVDSRAQEFVASWDVHIRCVEEAKFCQACSCTMDY